jgi:hypothetical protein
MILNNLGQKLSQQIQNDEIAFFEAVLGLPIHYHLGQVKWSAYSNKTINILRPGNKWGKSLFGGARHLRHAALKPLLPKNLTDEEWLMAKYDTLNFGPGYEQAREILRMARDICEGRVMLPEKFQHEINPYTGEEYGSMNKSLLSGWFITSDKSEAQQLPQLTFWTNVALLGRSYDQMGQAFKMKALAYASGDECADVKDLWTFTNGTLLPRMVTVSHPQIDYYGTPQPEGHDYMLMIEMAEEDMKKADYKENGMWYVQKGSMYENVFIPEKTIREIEAIADPVLREQIIRGEYVETGDKYFGFDRIKNIIDKDLKLQDYGYPGRRYITAVDFAGGESTWADFTVIMTIDYTEEPYKVVQFRRFKGGDVSIPMQYKLVEEICLAFGGKGTLIIDSSALGGKNAMAFLSHLLPISAEFGPNRSSTHKAEMLATLKIALDGGQSGERKRQREKIDDKWVDKTAEWGLIKTPDIPVLISELTNYKLDDAKIRQDCVMTLAMLIHWIDMRRPKKQKKQAVDFDLLSSV